MTKEGRREGGIILLTAEDAKEDLGDVAVPYRHHLGSARIAVHDPTEPLRLEELALELLLEGPRVKGKVSDLSAEKAVSRLGG
jgi:hypothetical protein